MNKITNRKIPEYVRSHEPFRANNVFAERFGDGGYAVYSYGYHFPICGYIKGKWYINQEKYSPTTTRHQSLAYPRNASGIVSVPLEELKRLIQNAR